MTEYAEGDVSGAIQSTWNKWNIASMGSSVDAGGNHLRMDTFLALTAGNIPFLKNSVVAQTLSLTLQSVVTANFWNFIWTSPLSCAIIYKKERSVR